MALRFCRACLAGIIFFLSWMIVGNAAAQQVLPSFAQVRASHLASDGILLDRRGEPLADIRFDLTTRRADWLGLSNAPIALRESLLAAEDKRFFEHAGVDWVAVAGAAWQNLWGTRRGASTLTMQLAGLLDPALRMPGSPGARRSVAQKWDQGLAAVELEKHWSKPQIFEAYLNLAPFRGDLQGVGAASEVLFGMPAAALKHREACILAALLRGPNAKPPMVARRACTLASKLGKASLCGEITQLAIARLDQPRGARYQLAPHLARLLLRQPGQKLTTNLDADLQRKLINELRTWPDPSSSAIVLDNATGEVLAWVGGLNPTMPDGVSLKRPMPEWSWPHLAALALERRQLTAASPLMDASAIFDANDSRTVRSWRSLRAALATHNAGNMRQLAALLGRDAVQERLRSMGIEPGEQGESGNEISLAQLAAAWRPLIMSGHFVPPRLLPGDNGVRNIGRADSAFIVLDMLGQAHASSWDILWVMPGAGASDTLWVGSTDRFTIALHSLNTANPRSAWHALTKALGSEYMHAPQPSENVLQTLVYFDPADEPPRREWFMRTAEMSGLVSFLPERRARIVQPQANSERTMTREEDERWALSAQIGVPVRWILDGHPIGEGPRIEWEPTAGLHRLSLLSANDEVLDSLSFTATLPEPR